MAMSTSKTRLIAAVIALCLFAIIYGIWRDSKKVIKPTVRPTFDSMINIHGSPRRGLRVCGKHFSDLMGDPSFWMPVPDSSLILFACHLDGSQRVLVVCNTNTCAFDVIPLYSARFGHQIGRKIFPPENWGDTIESVSSNKVVLVSVGFKYREKAILDLSEKSVWVVELWDERAPPLELP